MDLNEVIWKSQYVEKLAVKHLVSTTEVEEILFKEPFARFWEKGTSGVKTSTWLMGKLKLVGIWWYS